MANNFAPCQNYDPSWNKEVTDEKLSRRTLMTSFGGHRSPTSWVRSCKLGMQLDLYAIYVCCEFKRIRAINMVPMPEKPHFWPDDVTLGVNYPPSSWARTSKLGVQWGQIVPYRSPPRSNGWTHTGPRLTKIAWPPSSISLKLYNLACCPKKSDRKPFVGLFLELTTL